MGHMADRRSICPTAAAIVRVMAGWGRQLVKHLANLAFVAICSLGKRGKGKEERLEVWFEGAGPCFWLSRCTPEQCPGLQGVAPRWVLGRARLRRCRHRRSHPACQGQYGSGHQDFTGQGKERRGLFRVLTFGVVVSILLRCPRFRCSKHLLPLGSISQPERPPDVRQNGRRISVVTSEFRRSSLSHGGNAATLL